MKSIYLLAFVAFVAINAQKTPTIPIFPSQYSATVVWIETEYGTGPPLVSSGVERWFVDNKMQTARYDTFNPQESEITTGFITNDAFYAVYYFPNSTRCQITGKGPYFSFTPDFSKYQYSGVVLINESPTNKWVNVTSNYTYYYFENASSRQPVRYVSIDTGFHDFTLQHNFYEVDEGPQDPNLFVIPYNILANCSTF